MEFFYYSKRCRKQRQMGITSTSIPAAKLYRNLAQRYAAKAELSMFDMTFPRFDVQLPRASPHRALSDIALRRYIGRAFAR